MQAMQYEITLPADYDMAVIRDRVATRGTMTDDFEGLGLKAYAIRERGVDGSPVNQYAPFYLWASLDGMNRFLWGAGFEGFSRDFGRPVVRQWTGVAFERGPASEAAPRAATRRVQPIAPDDEARAVIEAAAVETHERAREPAVYSTALAVDTRAWELVQLILWGGRAPESAAFADAAETTYEVLHLSSPQVDDLKVGRQW
ncbi:MAG: hypothetical protein V7607_1330 [Solirubrobacteraceae bacterium]